MRRERNMYGCNTRNHDYKGVQDGFVVQDGYKETGAEKRPKFRWMPNRNSRDCKYDRVNIDPKCEGCTTENHLREVTKKALGKP